MKEIGRVFIANRADSARRIALTCEKLNIDHAVAYTSDDEDSLHVKENEGKKYWVSSYINIDSILNAAREFKADALAPGIGFLAENPLLVRACREANILFLGPSEEAMKIAGDKEAIKRIGKKQKVPVPPSSSLGAGAKNMAEWGKKHGLSNEQNSVRMMLKAAHGGGGLGNQIVENFSDLESILKRLKIKSKKLWKSSRIFLELLMPEVRHVEVQLLGDQHRNLVALGTRDCSLQEHQQKIIEEAPAPFLSPEQEKLLYEYALRIGKAIKYSSVGTVEFLLGSNGDIFFMEFNPRLQVEHGVTELITGIDLVEQQIRVAEGRKLTKAVKNPQFNGHAVEARINAQTIGVVEEVIFPKGKDIRVDHSLYNGYKINPNCAPTQAKVMARSDDREGAIDALKIALGELVVKGIETNIPLLKSLLSHPKFQKGEHTTKFVEDWLADKKNREKAAAIGVGLALAFGDQQIKDQREAMSRPMSAWKLAGRMNQFR